jgi:hypothetical protein
MNPRHAAALALVGWYLMVPPTGEHFDPVCSGGFSISDSVLSFVLREGKNDRFKWCYNQATVVGLRREAPLSEWYQEDEFETLAECRGKQEDLGKFPNKLTKYDVVISVIGSETDSSMLSDHDLRQIQTQAALASRCVASDDPRLRGN